ncbi:MAG: MarR family transcriptional regulator [Pseudomonadota bacterium]
MKKADGLGTQLRRLLELLDGDLEKIYRGDGSGYRPRYTPVMKTLADGDARTIKEIAASSSISHSAASQTVSRMIEEEFVEQSVGEDSRERLIKLTGKGRRILPHLQMRWAATQSAADQLDRELSAPLSRTLAEAIDALSEHSFAERIATHEQKKTKARK